MTFLHIFLQVIAAVLGLFGIITIACSLCVCDLDDCPIWIRSVLGLGIILVGSLSLTMAIYILGGNVL